MSPAVTTNDPSRDLVATLESHRDLHFRRVTTRRLGEREVLNFINQVGFCTAFTAGLGVPCVREALCGEREPPLPEHIQHDWAIGVTWRLKDSLPASKRVYYGKVIGGRPGFISLDLLPSFLRLRVEVGGYLAMYKRGGLSHCAKLVMDALCRRGPSETRALKLGSGHAAPEKRPIFDRAMKELQEKFLALKVEERYEPFTYVWDTLEHQWSDVIPEARQLTPVEAAYKLIRRYFEIAGYGQERAVARVLGINPEWVERSTRRLEREKFLVRDVRLPGISGRISMLALYR